MLGDTIFAVASPPGAAERGILRVSGPDALPALRDLLSLELPCARAAHERQIEVLGFPVECLVLVMPGPASYTGEDVVELHLPGSPLLLENVQAMLRGRLRDATPGEFTRRAYENGKLDLAEAEAVLDLIHAAGEEEGRRAMFVLSGDLSVAVDRARAAIQDARALLEAGLDFTEGETGEVDRAQWLPRLEDVRAQVASLRAGLPQAAPGGELLLLGAANAGKSSLCNALAGEARILVSEVAGTTRDVLSVEIAPDVRLLDAPGDLVEPCGTETAALALRDHLAAGAGGALLIVDATAPRLARTDLPVVAVVVTKLDLAPIPAAETLPQVPCFAVSNVTGAGLAELRRFLESCGGGGPRGARRRTADLLARAEEALRRAIDAARSGALEEVVAVELGEALDLLDAVHGQSTPEDLLDRIFGDFCLGK